MPYSDDGGNNNNDDDARVTQQSRRYEEYAYVLDFTLRGRSTTVRGREGVIVTAIGESRLTLLEILGTPNSNFEIASKVYIGKEGRTNVDLVLGKLTYEKLSNTARQELAGVVEMIVQNNERYFINYLNNAQPLTPRIHALDLIPGIGKMFIKTMLAERDKKQFESYEDLQERVGLKDPVQQISKRIMEEIIGDARMNLFVKK